MSWSCQWWCIWWPIVVGDFYAKLKSVLENNKQSYAYSYILARQWLVRVVILAQFLETHLFDAKVHSFHKVNSPSWKTKVVNGENKVHVVWNVISSSLTNRMPCCQECFVVQALTSMDIKVYTNWLSFFFFL